MAHKALSTFTIDSWDEETFDEREGSRLFRTRITKTYAGDFAGTSRTEATMAVSAVEGSAAYVAIERLDGDLHGRAGSFVLQHTGISDRGDGPGAWTIVPDTGTGELTGLRGTGELEITPDGGHTIVLDYEIVEAATERA